MIATRTAMTKTSRFCKNSVKLAPWTGCLVADEDAEDKANLRKRISASFKLKRFLF